MKILIVSDNVAPYRIEWAEELGKKNEVTFAFFKKKDSERNDSWLVEKSKNVDLLKLKSIILKNHSISFAFIKCYKKIKPDILIFDGYGIIPNIIGILYMSAKRKKFFVNVDGIVLDAKETKIKKIVKKIMFNKYAFFLCSSKFTMEYLQKYGAKSEQMIAHNFSSIHRKEILPKVPTKNDRNSMKEKLGLKQCPTVLAVGRFLKLKQFDMLIEAFKNFDLNNQLVIIGEGNEENIYIKKINENSLNNVKIVEFLDILELKKYYFAADVLILPSYSEVWGLVVNEGMGYGALPIIVSDRCVVGYSMVKNQKTGYQFHYNSLDELIEKMNRVLSNEELRADMSENSLLISRNFTIEGMADLHCKWFEQLGY